MMIGISMALSARRALGPSLPLTGLTVTASATTVVGHEGVFFEAAPTGFGIPIRDVQIKWDFQEDDTYQSIDATHPHGNSSRIAYGFATAHVWPTPGTKAVTCTVTDRNGATLSETVNITVTDADTFFAGTKTLVVDPDYDGANPDPAAPAGAQHFDNIDSAITIFTHHNNNATDMRLLLKRGATYSPTSGIVCEANARRHFGAWGVGADPIYTSSFQWNRDFSASPGDSGSWGAASHIDLNGPYDPTTGATASGSAPPAAFRGVNDGYPVTVYRCSMTGYDYGMYLPNGDLTPSHLFIIDSDIRDWWDFGILADNCDIALRGTKIWQDPEAIKPSTKVWEGPTNPSAPKHGCFRASVMSTGQTIVVSHCDLFTTGGWTGQEDQPALRLMAFMNPDGSNQDSRVVLDRTIVEGGWQVCQIADSTSDDQVGGRIEGTVEKCVFVGTANTTSHMLNLGHSGVVVSNCIFIHPDVATETDRARSAFVGETNTEQTTEAMLSSSLWIVRNCTCISTLSPANYATGETDGAVALTDPSLVYTQAGLYNNINLDILTANPYTPVTTTATGWRAPRYLGSMYDASYQVGTLDTAFATPTAAIQSFQPEAGSSALGAATAAAAPVDDFFGNIRGTTSALGAFKDESSALADAYPPPAAPVASDDTAAVDADATVIVAPLANDILNGATVTAFDATSTGGGTVSDNGDGTFTYDPNGQFDALGDGETDTDTFTYTITNATGSDVGTVTVTVTGVPAASSLVTPLMHLTATTPPSDVGGTWTWADQSGNGNHATISTGNSAQPTNGTDGSDNYVTFQQDDHMVIPTAVMASAKAIIGLVRLETTADLPDREKRWIGSQLGSRLALGYYVNLVEVQTDAGVSRGSGVTVDADNLWVMLNNADDTASSVYVDGTEEVTGIAALPLGTNDPVIGASREGLESWFYGRIYAIVALDTANPADVQAWAEKIRDDHGTRGTAPALV